MAEQTDEGGLSKVAQLVQGLAKPLVVFLTFIIPPTFVIFSNLYAWWKKLPQNAASFLIGFLFCFFGGLYPTVFAAVQAAEHGGRQAVVNAVGDLADEALKIIEASKKDDQVDKDKDGKADVSQMEGSEYVIRKTKLVLAKMDPEKVNNAIAAIYKVWLAVLAVLTIQFARTINLALTISDFIQQPVNRFIAPVIQLAFPKEYQKWVPVVLGWIAKSIAMSIAWSIQTVISAITSAMAGGLMMARSVYNFCSERGYTFMGMVPNKHDESYIDEVLSYIFAAMGFYFQYSLHFDVPFPFNLLLFPFEFAEHYIRWTITKVSG